MHTYGATDVDRLLEDALRAASVLPHAWSPASNVYEDARSFRVEAAVPGFAREAVEVTFEDSVLTIKGQHQEEETESRHYFLREMVPGIFARSFRVPTAIDATQVTATVKDGVLTVELPKREETKLRRIQVQ
jgi:HSP20 family protein